MANRSFSFLGLWIGLFVGVACSDQAPQTVLPSGKLFTLLPGSFTGVGFENRLEYTEEFNVYTYRNFYNGGGVGIGDINNDSLPDLFFCGNMVENKLYLNKGSLQFEDITQQAGVACPDVWTTGVSMADVNGDGWLDIYVCKSGKPGGERRYNELFINNGDLTFSEKAKEYGLAEEGLSTHAAFFDYDRDGDLDVYLLNNSIRSVGGYDLIKDQRNIRDTEGGNKLLRNDGNRFTDVSEQAGIYGSAIGFGLGVTVGDVNGDHWPDIFVSNDFFERDYLYINNQDGTFTESAEQYFNSLSLGSMGADMADLNNDGFPEIFVTEMMPQREDRIKTKASFENWDKYQLNVKMGYHHQFPRNVLQRNNGNGTFSEIGRMAGVHATDWSWGALMADLDNDGLKDIFVANGIYKDLLDQDYINFMADPQTVREILKKEKSVIKKLVDMIPSERLPNFAFANLGDYQFENKAQEWGLGEPSHSNGSAYGDLDNDGDLDLVINNANQEAFVYRNEANTLHTDRKWLKVQLIGKALNTLAFGSKVTVFAAGKQFLLEQMPVRGFESTVDNRLHFGLGDISNIDSIVVNWPDGSYSVTRALAPNQVVVFDQPQANPAPVAKSSATKDHTLLQQATLTGLDYIHQENPFSDFDRDRLLFQMHSTEGPSACVGDFNGDRLEDLWIGGGAKQASSLFIQMPNGSFKKVSNVAFEQDHASEDTDCACFDADNDGDLDIYAGSGGSEFNPNSTELLDRLYLNNGRGSFTRSNQALPLPSQFVNTGAVAAHDFDGDGDMDLFVGERMNPMAYGLPSGGLLLENEGRGKFKDVTADKMPALRTIGMVTDATWADIDGDRQKDLIVVGEWMPIKVFKSQQGAFQDISEQVGTQQLTGWWNRVTAADLNGDGWEDLIVGNHGLNSRFKASQDQPLRMYVGDFDGNSNGEQLIECFNEGKPYPMSLRQDLVMQMPILKKKYLKFENYAGKQISDLFSAEQLNTAYQWEARVLESGVLMNQKGIFTWQPLPKDAQLSPIYGLLVTDIDRDNRPDILFGGNFMESKPEVGRYDASWGGLYLNQQEGFRLVPNSQNGLQVRGAVRQILPIRTKNQETVFLFIRNQAQTIGYTLQP